MIKPEEGRERLIWYLVFNILIVLKEILKDHWGIPGVILVVDAGAVPFRIRVFAHCQGVPAE